MHPSPKKIETDFLIESVLLQICMGQNEIVLHFEGDNYNKISITVESRIGIIYPEMGVTKFFDLIPTTFSATAIADFLGHSIGDIQYNEKGTLILKFKDGGSVALYNDNEDFVSYSIIHGNNAVMI